MMTARQPAARGPSYIACAAVLAVFGAAAIADAFSRLLWSTSGADGWDVWMLHRLTHTWFSGVPMYSTYNRGANYPPASWLMLWPVFHPPAVETARWLWAACNLAAVAALAVQAARALTPVNPRAATLAALALLSLPSLTHAVTLGQTAVVVLPLAIGGILLAMNPRAGWPRDLAAAGLFVLALLKPSSTAPLFLVLAIAPRRLRPAALAAGGYAALTAASLLAQPEPMLSQITAWIARTERLAGRGYGSLQNLLAAADRADLLPVAALVALGAFGAWAWRARHAEVWTLIGAGALVARLLVYHRVYDDVLACLALIAVARVACTEPATPRSRAAMALLAALAAVLWMPIGWHDGGWARLFVASHVAAFLLTLGALGWWGVAAPRRAARAS